MNEKTVDQEVDQADQETVEITLQDFNEFNQNYVVGTLGIIISLGFLFGALLGSIYGHIFK